MISRTPPLPAYGPVPGRGPVIAVVGGGASGTLTAIHLDAYGTAGTGTVPVHSIDCGSHLDEKVRMCGCPAGSPAKMISPGGSTRGTGHPRSETAISRPWT